MSNRNHHLINAYRQLSRQTDHYVLATIIETFGSTYQKAGARMLITETGELQGLLGGGCFERDLVEHARTVFETGQAKTVFYDMRAPDDVIWGLGLGCNGAVRIFLQRLTAADHFAPLNLIVEAFEKRQTGILTTIVESEHPDFPQSQSLFLPIEKNHVSWPVAAGDLPEKPSLQTHWVGGRSVRVFYDPLQPPTSLLLLGAGDDAMPVVECAKLLGWKVCVSDHRQALLHENRFPKADGLLHILPQNLRHSVQLDDYDAAVVMSHNLDHDRHYLAALAASKLAFIGLLGPSHRRDKLLQSLGDSSSQIADRVFGPVGLDIGAQTPEAIALSIIAGIHAALNGRTGLQLDKKTSTSHNHECSL